MSKAKENDTNRSVWVKFGLKVLLRVNKLTFCNSVHVFFWVVFLILIDRESSIRSCSQLSRFRWDGFQYQELLLQWRAGFRRVCTTSLPPSLQIWLSLEMNPHDPDPDGQQLVDPMSRKFSATHLDHLDHFEHVKAGHRFFSPSHVLGGNQIYMLYIIWDFDLKALDHCEHVNCELWIVNCGHRCFFNLAFSSFRSPPLSCFGSTFSKYGIYYKFQTNTLIIIRIFCCSKIVFLWCRPIFTMRLCSFQELPLGNLSFWSLFRLLFQKKVFFIVLECFNSKTFIFHFRYHALNSWSESTVILIPRKLSSKVRKGPRPTGTVQSSWLPETWERSY